MLSLIVATQKDIPADFSKSTLIGKVDIHRRQQYVTDFGTTDSCPTFRYV